MSGYWYSRGQVICRQDLNLSPSAECATNTFCEGSRAPMASARSVVYFFRALSIFLISVITCCAFSFNSMNTTLLYWIENYSRRLYVLEQHICLSIVLASLQWTNISQNENTGRITGHPAPSLHLRILILPNTECLKVCNHLLVSKCTVSSAFLCGMFLVVNSPYFDDLSQHYYKIHKQQI